MANSIDNKVVSIEFNNASFEAKVAATLKSVENLQKSLTFEGAKNGFADLSKAADGVTLNGISEGIEGVSNKFIALTTIGVTALATLTTKAIDAGLQIAKSLAIQPIAQGFQEYELKMGAIQTIMAGSGASLEEVNAQLQALNTYSDQTIYSFADMTQNIGKFTNAGVDLNTSVNAIKGIANVAALSGANAEEAARSMYNFAQSLSSGSVKLMDWKSIELANMATVEFKTQLLESAVAAGTLTKQIDGTYATLEGTPVTATKGFNESLQEQWLSSEALVETLERYSDATTDIGARATAAATEVKTFTQLMSTVKESVGSGWASSFEILFGNFEEAKSLFTGINDAIGGYVGASADARNALLQGWKDLGGRTLLIDSIGTAFYALGKALAPIKEAFRDIFPKQTAEGLFSLTQSFALFTQKLIPTQETVDKIRRIFSGFFSAIKIGIEVVKGVFSVFTNLFDLFAGSAASGGILEFFALIGDGITALKEVLVDGRKISSFFDGINESVTSFITGLDFTPVIEAFKKVKDAIVDFVESIDFSPLIEAFEAVKEAVKSIFNRDLGVPEAASQSFNAFKQVIAGVADIFQQIIDKVGSFISGMGGAADAVGDGISQVSDAISDIFAEIGKAFESPDFNFDNVLKVAAAGLFGGLIVLIRKFLKDGIKIDFGQFALMDQLKEVLGGVTGSLKAMQTNIKADTLMKIAIALGVLTAAILVLSLIDGEDLAKALGALSVGIIQLSGAMLALTKLSEGPMSAAKLILLAIGLTILAGAVLLLGLSAKLLSTMSYDELARGLLGVTGLLVSMAAAVKLLGNPTGMISAGIGILAISAGLLVMGLALKLISSLGWEEIAKGLVGIAGGLYVMSTSMARIPVTGMIQASIAVGLMSVSLLLLGVAIRNFAGIDFGTMAAGLGGIAATLAVMVTALNKIDSRQILQIGLSMILLGVALNLIAKAVEAMGALSAGSIIKGILGLGVVLLLLATAMKSVEKAGVGNAITLFIMAASLEKLSGVLKNVGELPWSVIIKGIVGLGLVLGGFIALGYAVGPIVVPLLAFGAAIALIGAGFGLFGMGAAGVARAIQILATTGAAGVKVFVSVLDDLLAVLPKIAVALGSAAATFVGSFLMGLEELIPAIVSLIGALLVAIQGLVPQIVDTVVVIIEELLGAIQVLYPELVETGLGLILALLEGIKEALPDIIDAALGIIVALLEGIANNLGDITTAAASIVVALIEGIGGAYLDIIAAGAKMIADIIAGIGQAAGDIVTAGANAIISFLEGVASNVLMVIDAGFQIVIDFLNGLADSIEKNRGELAAAGFNLLDAIFGGVLTKALEVMAWFVALPADIVAKIGGTLLTLVQIGKDLITGLWDGIKEMWDTAKVWIKNIPTMIKNAVGDGLDILLDVGKNIVRGIWDGIAAMKDWLMERLKDMVGWIPGWAKKFLGIESPSKVMANEVGRHIPSGVAEGIENNSRVLQLATERMAGSIVDNFVIDEKDLTAPVVNAMHTLVEALSISNDFNPTITPVLDLSQVAQDAKLLKTLYPDLSSTVASNISASELEASSSAQELSPESGVNVNFVQNNNSPKALSTNDIYRQTRNQIAIAKEELSIR